MRGPARWTALGSIVLALAGCSHWYQRGAIAVGAGAAWGAGLGALIPCSDQNPSCQPAQTGTVAVIGILGAIGVWGIGELVFALHEPASTDEYLSSGASGPSGSSGDDDTSSSGGGDATSDGDGDGASTGDGNGASTGDGDASGSDDTYQKIRDVTSQGGGVLLGNGTTTDGDGSGSGSESGSGSGSGSSSEPPPDSHGCSGSCYWDDCTNQCWCNPNKTPAC